MMSPAGWLGGKRCLHALAMLAADTKAPKDYRLGLMSIVRRISLTPERGQRPLRGVTLLTPSSDNPSLVAVGATTSPSRLSRSGSIEQRELSSSARSASLSWASNAPLAAPRIISPAWCAGFDIPLAQARLALSFAPRKPLAINTVIFAIDTNLQGIGYLRYGRVSPKVPRRVDGINPRPANTC